MVVRVLRVQYLLLFPAYTFKIVPIYLTTSVSVKSPAPSVAWIFCFNSSSDNSGPLRAPSWMTLATTVCKNKNYISIITKDEKKITPFSPWTIVILREITYICLVFGFSDVYYFYFIFRRNICSQIKIHKQEFIKSDFDIHFRLIFTLMRKWWLIFWTSSGCTRVPPAVLTSCPSKVCKINTSTVKRLYYFLKFFTYRKSKKS